MIISSHGINIIQLFPFDIISINERTYVYEIFFILTSIINSDNVLDNENQSRYALSDLNAVNLSETDTISAQFLTSCHILIGCLSLYAKFVCIPYQFFDSISYRSELIYSFFFF